MEYLLASMREEAPELAESVDEPERHYAKWNRQVIKVQILYGCTCLSFLEKWHYTDAINNTAATEGWEGIRMELLFNEFQGDGKSSRNRWQSQPCEGVMPFYAMYIMLY